MTRPGRQTLWAAVAILFMLGFLGGLGLRMVGGHKTTLFTGPDHMAASADAVYVHANEHLFVLSKNGDTLQHVKPSQLKTVGRVIDLRLMPDGRLLVAERQPARIRLCDTRRWDCELVQPSLENKLSNWFKVVPSADGKLLYLVDSTKNGQLYRIDLANHKIHTIEQTVLSRANDLQWDQDGLLWVADSGHRRIVQLKIDDLAATEVGKPLPADNAASVKNRTWPMMLQALPGGYWAVTQPTDHGGKADILIYKDADTPPERLPLADDLDPTDIVFVNNRLLVSDIEGFALYAVRNTGVRVPWGDKKITNWLRQQQDLRDTYQGWVDGGLWLMIVCAPIMLVAGYFGTNRKKRRQLMADMAYMGVKLEPSDKPMPPLSGIYWLKRNRKMERLFKVVMPLVMTLMIIMAALVMYLLHLRAGRVPAEKLAVLAMQGYVYAGLLLGMLPLLFLSLKVARGQLGTDGASIYLRYPNGEQVSAPASDIVYSRNILQFAGRSAAVGARSKQALYEAGEIETWIAPLLKHGTRIGELAMVRRQLGGREPAAVYAWAYIVIAAGALAYVSFVLKAA